MMFLKRISYSFSVLALAISLTSCEEWFPSPDTEENPTETSINYVYTSDESGKYEVWKFENEQLTAITSNSSRDCWWPKVSPNKKHILFYESSLGRSVNDYGSAVLHIMNADGTDKRELIVLGQDNQFSQQGLANWSHDGKKIVFAAQDLNLTTWQIYELDIDANVISRISAYDNKNYLDPIYANDDNAIYCVTSPDSGSDDTMSEIYEIDITTKAETRLTNNDRRDHHPFLSPDGSKLIYESMTDPEYLTIGKWDIMQLDLNTNSESKLIDAEGIRLFPEFSSDGKKVYFTELKIESASLSIGAFEIATAQLLTLETNGANSMNVSPY